MPRTRRSRCSRAVPRISIHFVTCEQRAKETIQQLKMEIANLSRLVEQGAGLTLGQENTVNELMKQKEELTQERDALTQQVVSYRNEIGDYGERVKALEAEKSVKDAEIAELTEQIARLKSDGERELRRKERLEKDAKDMKIMLEKKQEEVNMRI